jgi:hypothetical protein
MVLVHECNDVGFVRYSKPFISIASWNYLKYVNNIILNRKKNSVIPNAQSVNILPSFCAFKFFHIVA